MGRPLDDYQRLLLKVVTPRHMAQLLKLMADGVITRASGREVLHIMFDRAEATIRRMAEALPKEPATMSIGPYSWASRLSAEKLALLPGPDGQKGYWTPCPKEE